jgi:hypothetical protein
MSKKVTLESLERMIPSLLEKDIQLGYKFLKERKFEELLDLVESDIIKVRRRLKNDEDNEFLKKSFNDLNDLQLDLIIYTEDSINDMDIDEYLNMEAEI